MKSRWAIISAEELDIDESFLIYAYKEHDKEACIGSVLKRKQDGNGEYNVVENIRDTADLDKNFFNEFDELETNIIKLLNKRDQVPLVAFEFMKTNHSVRLVKIMRKPPFPVFCCFDDAFNDHLRTLTKKSILSYRTRKRGKIIKKLSHIFLNLKELLLVGKGFTPRNAKKWILKKYVDNKLMCAEGRKKLLWAHRHGFTCESMQLCKINKDNYRQFVSEKQFLGVMPLNMKYQKWFSNMTNSYYMFKPFLKYFPEFIYHVLRRDGEQIFIPMSSAHPDSDYYSTLLYYMKHRGHIVVSDIKWNTLYRFTYREERFFQNDKEVDFPYIERTIKKIKGEFLILSNRLHGENSSLKDNLEIALFIYNENGKNPKIGSAYINVKDRGGWTRKPINLQDGRFDCNGYERSILPWDNIVDFVDSLCRFIPQIKFFEMDLAIRNNDFMVEKILNYPEYQKIQHMSTEMNDFLIRCSIEKSGYYRKIHHKFARMFDVVKRRVRKNFASILYPPGLVPYLSVTWIRDVISDFLKNSDCSFKEKIWAYKHGFLSYRLEQYDINEDNWKNFISDFEYKWLRHINPHYKAWLEDKLSLKYIAQEYKEFFPEYYFHIICKNGENNIIPLLDCPNEYLPDFDDIIRLIKDKRSVALKPDEGSHGDGFFRCDYDENGKFYLNYKEATKKDIVQILTKEGSSYIITEYIQMHSKLKEIYSGSVNTIRMLVFKKDGENPKIGNAYMRIGTEATGTIDNMSAGGMFAAIDVNTGEYGNAKIFQNGDIHDCPKHPNTGVLIEGKIPNWERTKKLVLELASSIKELEYFGFDVAVTETGIKIPEINRYPDYPKIEKFSRLTIDYLLYKLKCKKQKYSKNGKMKKTLIHLPNRDE